MAYLRYENAWKHGDGAGTRTRRFRSSLIFTARTIFAKDLQEKQKIYDVEYGVNKELNRGCCSISNQNLYGRNYLSGRTVPPVPGKLFYQVEGLLYRILNNWMSRSHLQPPPASHVSNPPKKRISKPRISEIRSCCTSLSPHAQRERHRESFTTQKKRKGKQTTQGWMNRIRLE